MSVDLDIVEPGAPEYVAVRFKRRVTCYKHEAVRSDSSLFAILQCMYLNLPISDSAKLYVACRDNNIDASRDQVTEFNTVVCNGGTGPVKADVTVYCERVLDISKLSPGARAFFEAWQLHGDARKHVTAEIYCELGINVDNCTSTWTDAELSRAEHVHPIVIS